MGMSLMGWMVLVLNASVSNSPHTVRDHFIPSNSSIRLLFVLDHLWHSYQYLFVVIYV